MDLFEAGGEFEEQGFVGDAGEELHTGGKPGWGEAAGNGNGGDATEVCGAIEAQEQGARGVFLSGDGNIFFTDERSSNWRGWRDEGIHFVFEQGEVESGDEFFAQVECAQVFERRDLFTHFYPRANIFSVIGRVERIPTGLLVIVSGF